MMGRNDRATIVAEAARHRARDASAHECTRGTCARMSVYAHRVTIYFRMRAHTTRRKRGSRAPTRTPCVTRAGGRRTRGPREGEP